MFMSKDRTLLLSGASYLTIRLALKMIKRDLGKVAYVVSQVLAVIDGALAFDRQRDPTSGIER